MTGTLSPDSGTEADRAACCQSTSSIYRISEAEIFPDLFLLDTGSATLVVLQTGPCILGDVDDDPGYTTTRATHWGG